MTTPNPYRPQRIGNLRDRVVLQKRVVTYSGSGEPIITHNTLATVFARVEPLKGEEKAAMAQIVAKQRFNVHVRWRNDLTVLDRVVWSGMDLDITATGNPDERRRFLQLDCEAFVP